MPINFSNITYVENSDTINNISLSYSEQNVYELTGNKRFIKKAQKKNIYPLAVKLINSTDNSVNYNDLNIEIFNDYSQVEIIEQETYIKKLEQKTYLYSLYLLGISTSFNYYSYDDKFHYSFLPTIIFSGIAIYNGTKSFLNNKKFYFDIENYEMFNKTVPANSQIEGIIFIETEDIKDVKIRINEK